MTTKTKTPVEPMTLEEIRAALDGEEKAVFLKLSGQWETPSFLKNVTPDEIASYLKRVVKDKNFTPNFKLDYRNIPVTKSRKEYVSGKGYQTKVSTRSEGPYWVLVAYEPYTDEELLEKGPKLVAAKKKRDQAAAKRLQRKVDDFNKKARELGQPEITVEDLK